MATFCAAQVAATCIERINSRRLFPRSNRLKVFMTGFYAIVPGKIATDAAAEENSPTAGKKSFGAIEGTRTPTPLPVHGPEPCASANSATMAIWTCNAAAALKAAVSGRPTLLFYSPTTGCQTILSQLRRHRNLRVQHLRHGTALLRRFRILLKRRRIRSRNLADHINVARSNCTALIQLLHPQSHLVAHPLRLQICPSQLRRQP